MFMHAKREKQEVASFLPLGIFVERHVKSKTLLEN
jgi:hypothetical protein